MIRRDGHTSLLWWALALVVAMLLLGFAVRTPAFDHFDRMIAQPLSLTEQSSAAVIRLMIWISWVGGGLQRYIIVGAIAVILWLAHSRMAGAMMALTSLGANLASTALKAAYGRHRPDLVPQLDPIGSAAYPSGHATSAAVVYLLIAAIAPPRWRPLAFAAAIVAMLLNGASRIMLGVHWPTDVAGGTMLGTAFALVGIWAIDRPERLRARAATI